MLLILLFWEHEPHIGTAYPSWIHTWPDSPISMLSGCYVHQKLNLQQFTLLLNYYYCHNAAPPESKEQFPNTRGWHSIRVPSTMLLHSLLNTPKAMVHNSHASTVKLLTWLPWGYEFVTELQIPDVEFLSPSIIVRWRSYGETPKSSHYTWVRLTRQHFEPSIYLQKIVILAMKIMVPHTAFFRKFAE
jgi:hypothetical protein